MNGAAISDDLIFDAESTLIKKDPLRLVEKGFLKIKTKDHGLIPLIPNTPQRRFLKLFKRLRKENKPIRIVILKCRQWGGTTITDAIEYSLSSQQENVNAMIIADDIKGANYILEMGKLLQSELEKDYPHLATPVKRSNRLELAFRDSKSWIFIDSAENKDAGQKYTLQYLHCSEVSKFPHPEELFTGLLPAVSKAPGSFVVFESTANGIGDYFYKVVKQAERQDGDWALFFVPWMEHDEYTRPFQDDEEYHALIDTLNDEEKNLLKISYETIDGPKRVTLEQLNWRRWIIKNEFHGDLDKFHEMYPSSVDEAFLVSGRPRFNIKVLAKMRTTAKAPIKRGYLTADNSESIRDCDLTWEDNPKGYIKIWQKPIPERRYVLGGDVAEGKIQIEGKKDPDFSCLQVLDRRTLEQVATWHGRIDPDLLGIEAIKLARYYNNAFVGIERNNHGLTTITRIKNENYWTVHQVTVYDEINDREVKQLGWTTSTKTKPLMIDDLAKLIREYLTKINDVDTIQECMTYVIEEDGKTNAQPGCFDDRVIAYAIAFQMTKSFYDMPDRKEPPEDQYGTFEYYKKQIDEEMRKPVIV